MYSKTIYSSPVGDLTLVADEKSLVLLEFSDGKELKKKLLSLEKSGRVDDTNTSAILEQTKQELDEYFQGKRKVFTVPYKFLSGTEFQQKAWNALATIPYWETRSYFEEAVLVGSPKAVRAIWGANHFNPIVIIVPCHRVIGKNKSLTGYGWGIERKQFLLHLEGVKI